MFAGDPAAEWGGQEEAPGRLSLRAPSAGPGSHAPYRDGACSAAEACSATEVALRETGGVTRDGDRLDKAGQPGGPVSAVYSPTAARRRQDLAWSHACPEAGR